MFRNLERPRRLLCALVGAVLLGALSTGPAGAAFVDQAASGQSTLNTGGVQKCVPVLVPSATATINASLHVSAAGVNHDTQSSTTVSTRLGTVTICVSVSAQAQVNVNAAVVSFIGSGGAVLRVHADVLAQTAVQVRVTANGVQIL